MFLVEFNQNTLNIKNQYNRQESFTQLKFCAIIRSIQTRVNSWSKKNIFKKTYI